MSVPVETSLENLVALGILERAKEIQRMLRRDAEEANDAGAMPKPIPSYEELINMAARDVVDVRRRISEILAG